MGKEVGKGKKAAKYPNPFSWDQFTSAGSAAAAAAKIIIILIFALVFTMRDVEFRFLSLAQPNSLGGLGALTLGG